MSDKNKEKQLFIWPRKCERNKRNQKKNNNFHKVTQTYYLNEYNKKFALNSECAPGQKNFFFLCGITLERLESKQIKCDQFLSDYIKM